MKTFSHIYNQAIQLPNLLQAWEEFKKGKRRKEDVGIFEKDLEGNLFALHKELKEQTYRHGRYGHFFISDPKVRHIHKATVRDRVVHHLVFRVLNPMFEPMFIHDSFSCRVGYGTHKGFDKLVVYARKVSANYSRDCWVLKCDIEKFFDSVDHLILFGLIRKKVRDRSLLRLVKKIIDSYETAPGKGVPIGNLTSQLFANIYLNELDWYVKQVLRIKYYLRYTDDFVVLSRNKSVLRRCVKEIGSFLAENLLLRLHSNKTVFRRFSWGIDFLGYVALPHYQIVRTKTRRRIFRKLKEKIGTSRFSQSLQSYLGFLNHANSYKLTRRLYETFGSY